MIANELIKENNISVWKKSRKGGIIKQVFEKYLRDDISCYSPLCKKCLHNSSDFLEENLNASACRLLDKESQFYLIIGSPYILNNYIELFKFVQQQNNIIFLQSIVAQFKKLCGQRSLRQYKEYIRDKRRNCVFFDNETFTQTFCKRNLSENEDDYVDRVVRKACEQYAEHILNATTENEDMEVDFQSEENTENFLNKMVLQSKASAPKIFVIWNENRSDLLPKSRSDLNLYYFTLEDFVKDVDGVQINENRDSEEDVNGDSKFRKTHESIKKLHKSLFELSSTSVKSTIQNTDLLLNFNMKDTNSKHTQSLNETSQNKNYEKHLGLEELKKGCQESRYFHGHLIVSEHNSMQEAIVDCTNTSHYKKDLENKQDQYQKFDKILIMGNTYRNRAVHRDEVAVEILPRELQTDKKSNIVLSEDSNVNDDEEEGKGENDERKSEKQNNQKSLMPCGRIVGIFKRNWRSYVATVQKFEDEDCDKSKEYHHNTENILCVPYDHKIPKICLKTRQVGDLRGLRLRLEIDSQPHDSRYPIGHYVEALGPIGDQETEIKVILIENSLEFVPFGSKLINCLPKDQTIPKDEISKRKDIRDSHLVFSVDPIGCEDIDDALSYKRLENENYEIGVHIADVTYFVEPNSLIDNEASIRGTTVYLNDRRIDMIPKRLSSGECSLHSNQDRLAVSIFWEVSLLQINNQNSNFSFEVKILKKQFSRTVIRSSFSLTYQQANAILCGKKKRKVMLETKDKVYSDINIHSGSGSGSCDEWNGLPDEILSSRKFDELRESLTILSKIASHFKNERMKAGSVRFGFEQALELNEITESNISFERLNEEGNSYNGIMNSHYIIEEFMIHANRCVAKHIHQYFPQFSVLRRHPYPLDSDFDKFVELAKSIGVNAQISSNRELAQTLDSISKQSPQHVAQALNGIAIRAMAEAQYFCTSSYEISQFYHYGLAAEFYTHFTSPIRRYADILVHRLLLASLNSGSFENMVGNEESPFRSKELGSVSSVVKLCKHLNLKHRSAKNAQHRSKELSYAIALKNCDMLVKAIIVGLRENGFIVFIPRLPIPSRYENNEDEEDTSLRGAVFLKRDNDYFPIPKYWQTGLDKFKTYRIKVNSNDSRIIIDDKHLPCNLNYNQENLSLDVDIPDLNIFGKRFKLFQTVVVRVSLYRQQIINNDNDERDKQNTSLIPQSIFTYRQPKPIIFQAFDFDPEKIPNEGVRIPIN